MRKRYLLISLLPVLKYQAFETVRHPKSFTQMLTWTKTTWAPIWEDNLLVTWPWESMSSL